MGDHQSSKSSEASSDVVKEMLPFAFYAAIPIIITIFIAFTFGSLH